VCGRLAAVEERGGLYVHLIRAAYYTQPIHKTLPILILRRTHPAPVAFLAGSQTYKVLDLETFKMLDEREIEKRTACETIHLEVNLLGGKLLPCSGSFNPIDLNGLQIQSLI